MTLADFKRRIQVGTMLATKRYDYSLKHGGPVPLIIELSPAPVAKVQSSGFALNRKGSDQPSDWSWLEWPKAAMLAWKDANTVEIYAPSDIDSREPGHIILEYTFV